VVTPAERTEAFLVSLLTDKALRRRVVGVLVDPTSGEELELGARELELEVEGCLGGWYPLVRVRGGCWCLRGRPRVPCCATAHSHHVGQATRLCRAQHPASRASRTTRGRGSVAQIHD
jgi:hypothetical protein